MRLQLAKHLMDLYEDFIGGAITSQYIGLPGWLLDGPGYVIGAINAGHPGCIQMDTPGTSSVSRLALLGGSGQTGLAKLEDITYFGFTFKPQTKDANMGVRVGIQGPTAGISATEHGESGTYFEFWSASSPNWQCVTKGQAGELHVTDSGIPYTLGTWNVLEVYRTTDNKNVFLIDNVIVATHAVAASYDAEVCLSVVETNNESKSIQLDQFGICFLRSFPKVVVTDPVHVDVTLPNSTVRTNH